MEGRGAREKRLLVLKLLAAVWDEARSLPEKELCGSATDV